MATYKSIRYLVPDEVVEHTDSINALSDVDTSTVAPEIGQTLKWIAGTSEWKPRDIDSINQAPSLSNTSTVTLAESANIGTSVATISASDLEGDTITYTITAGNLGLAFAINSSTGLITTATVLDYEMITSYTLTITATDSIGNDDTITQTVNITNVTETTPDPTQKAIFGFGETNSNTNITNLVSSLGVVATDTAGVGTARNGLAAANYGGDKAIFGFGRTSGHSDITNLVSNAGVVATDTIGVGRKRATLAAAGYGGDKALFGFGGDGIGGVSITNLVGNSGAVHLDVTGVGTGRTDLAASGYGGDKAIFGFGFSSYYTNITNLVSNTGVVATDTTGVGTIRQNLAAAGYGGDKAIFGFGQNTGMLNVTNLVSNLGVVSLDVTGVGTARRHPSAAGYGNDKAIFGFGRDPSSNTNVTNLVSNTGVVSSDTTGVGTARRGGGAAGYSSTA